MRKLLFLFSLVLLAGNVFAQTESLLIGPGDLLHIQVFDTPEMEQHVRVNDSGLAPLMFIGNVKLAGETPASAARMVEQLLLDKGFMRHPQVTVMVETFATQTVSVMGQVSNPGAYPISTPRTIVDVLSLAGGLSDAGDRHITIRRHSDPTQTVAYYYSNDSDQALKDAVLVYPGDTVVVPREPIIYVLGDVGKPGGFPVSTNNSQLTVLQAVALAGSENRTAVRSKVRLIRKVDGAEKEIPVQLHDIETGKQPDFPLQANDILYIPFSYMKNLMVNGTSIAAAATSAVIYK